MIREPDQLPPLTLDAIEYAWSILPRDSEAAALIVETFLALSVEQQGGLAALRPDDRNEVNPSV